MWIIKCKFLLEVRYAYVDGRPYLCRSSESLRIGWNGEVPPEIIGGSVAITSSETTTGHEISTIAELFEEQQTYRHCSRSRRGCLGLFFKMYIRSEPIRCCWVIASLTLSFVSLSHFSSAMNLSIFVEEPLHGCLHQFSPRLLWEHTVCADRQKDNKLSRTT